MATKKKSTAKRKPVPRHTRKYQFRDEHPMDQHVENVLNYWKSAKQEITNLRKAVALYYALEQGNLSELFEFFPQYKGQFTSSASVSGNSGEGHSELAKEIAAQIILQGGTGGYIMQSALPPAPAKLPLPKAQPVKTAATVSAAAITANMLEMFD